MPRGTVDPSNGTRVFAIVAGIGAAYPTDAVAPGDLATTGLRRRTRGVLARRRRVRRHDFLELRRRRGERDVDADAVADEVDGALPWQ
jgi:hypothetical protein